MLPQDKAIYIDAGLELGIQADLDEWFADGTEGVFQFMEFLKETENCCVSCDKIRMLSEFYWRELQLEKMNKELVAYELPV